MTVAGGQAVTLDLTGATINEAPMNPLQGFLHLLSDPNIAFVLFMIGVLRADLRARQNPNFVTGILGALAIILAFIGFGSLPLNVAGLLLIGLGLVLFVLEAQIVSHGLLTIGGDRLPRAGRVGALHAPRATRLQPTVQVATPVIVGHGRHRGPAHGALITLAAIRTRRMAALGRARSASPSRSVPRASSRRPLEPLGTVYLAGEAWTARTADERRPSPATRPSGSSASTA